ncbi:FkbM family methyltransferase [Spiribacter roseus]|uniref:FkbM family methyltransferase n=1 Tax=Spiribacter roseus TaxID=1855875 RepID=A0ABV3RX67_9GAMM
MRGHTFWRRLPEDLGSTTILCSADARLQHLKPGEAAFDPELLWLARHWVTEDAVIWDVGANIGVFALAATHRVTKGSVLAIEPDPWLFGLLARSVARLEMQSVRALCAAIGDEVGVADLAIAQRGRASNFLTRFDGRSQARGIRQLQSVPVFTLDTLLACLPPPTPTHIKIDVEGAEWAVLQGAPKLLETVRPKLFVEVGVETERLVTDYLAKLDYSISKRGSNLIANPN